jgi:hypothetical protein
MKEGLARTGLACLFYVKRKKTSEEREGSAWSLILPAFDGLITVAKDVRMQSAKSDVETKRKESK